ncbi:MAG: ankyrin repeat domain-containing protein [Planctomycetota bacterium]|jgi:ankyrin repeat protein
MVKRKTLTLTLLVLACSMIAGCGNLVADFHKAVTNGDLETAQTLLDEQPTLVNSNNGDNEPPLLKALNGRQTDMVVLLVDRGADFDIKDNRGFTPLHCAAQSGQTEIAELLIARGASVEVTDRIGHTPLHTAAEGGQHDIVVLLLAQRANVNAENRMGRTPLHVAAKTGHTDVVDILIAQGADVNARDKGAGRTPLHYAAAQAHSGVATLLLAKGAEVNAKDSLAHTPLYWASIRARKEGTELEVVDIIREHGGR